MGRFDREIRGCVAQAIAFIAASVPLKAFQFSETNSADEVLLELNNVSNFCRARRNKQSFSATKRQAARDRSCMLIKQSSHMLLLNHSRCTAIHGA
jgi:hypothetical protein